MGRIMKIIMGVVGVVIFSILIPILLPVIAALIAANVAPAFPGVTQITGLAPVLAVLGGLTSCGYLAYEGIANKGSGTSDMMRMIWGILVLFVFFVLFPIVLTSFDSMRNLMVAGNYTGSGIIPIVPMILEVGTLFGAGLLMFEGSTGKRVFHGHGGHKKSRRN
jgi:hypothetical protein